MVLQRQKFETWASELEVGDLLVFPNKTLQVRKVEVTTEGWPVDNPLLRVHTVEKMGNPLFYRASSEVVIRRVID